MREKPDEKEKPGNAEENNKEIDNRVRAFLHQIDDPEGKKIGVDFFEGRGKEIIV